MLTWIKLKGKCNLTEKNYFFQFRHTSVHHIFIDERQLHPCTRLHTWYNKLQAELIKKQIWEMLCIFGSTNFSTQSSCLICMQHTDKSAILKHHWLISAPTNLVVNSGGILWTGSTPWNCQLFRGCPRHAGSNRGCTLTCGFIFSCIQAVRTCQLSGNPPTPLLDSVINSHKYLVLHKSSAGAEQAGRKPILHWLPVPHTCKDSVSLQTQSIY